MRARGQRSLMPLGGIKENTPPCWTGWGGGTLDWEICPTRAAPWRPARAAPWRTSSATAPGSMWASACRVRVLPTGSTTSPLHAVRPGQHPDLSVGRGAGAPTRARARPAQCARRARSTTHATAGTMRCASAQCAGSGRGRPVTATGTRDRPCRSEPRPRES